MTNYMSAKNHLKEVSQQSKKEFKRDKPAIRQIINDTCYYLEVDKKLTENEKTRLQNYACKLHP